MSKRRIGNLIFSNRVLNNSKIWQFRTQVRYNSTSKNYQEPLHYNKAKSFKQMLKIPSGKLTRAFLISSSLTMLCLSGFYGTHWYIENYLHNTDERLSEEVRMFLRGAYIREEVAPDPTVVELYLSKARDKIIKDKEVPLDSLVLLDVSLRLAKSLVLRRKFVEATELFQICEFTLISKLEDKNLGEEERLQSVDKLVEVSQQFGELNFELKKFKEAGQQFQLGNEVIDRHVNFINEAKNEVSSNITESTNYDFRKRKVDLELALAGAEAKLGNYNEAITTYNRILTQIRHLQPQPTSDTSTAILHPWGCVEAITLNYLAEVTYASKLRYDKTKAVEDSLQIAWSAYKSCKSYIDVSLAGDKTAALTLYCLAKLYLLDTKFQDNVQACACLAKAIRFADKACEYQLTLEIGNLLAQVQPKELES